MKERNNTKVFNANDVMTLKFDNNPALQGDWMYAAAD